MFKDSKIGEKSHSRMDPKDYGDMIDGYSAYGTIATIISLAKDVGVLDILCNSDVPMTSQDIADEGQLKERYVREMLGSLVCGKVVQVDEDTSSLFSISQDLKPVVKEKSIISQVVPHMGDMYNAIRNCFRTDGPAGVRYSEFPRLFSIMKEERETTADKFLEQDVFAADPHLIGRLESGIEALEIGCAHAIALLKLSQRFPKSTFCGSDVVDSVLDEARKAQTDIGLNNCEFTNLDICTSTDLPVKKYDWIITHDVIHDLPDPAGAISKIFEMLKPGGVFSMTDFGVEGSLAENAGNIELGFMYTASTFFCIPESYQGQGSAAWGPCWKVKTVVDMLTSAGFTVINKQKNDLNPLQVTYVCQRPL